jgi:hypothetical protein
MTSPPEVVEDVDVDVDVEVEVDADVEVDGSSSTSIGRQVGWRFGVDIAD